MDDQVQTEIAENDLPVVTGGLEPPPLARFDPLDAPIPITPDDPSILPI